MGRHSAVWTWRSRGQHAAAGRPPCVHHHRASSTTATRVTTAVLVVASRYCFLRLDPLSSVADRNRLRTLIRTPYNCIRHVVSRRRFTGGMGVGNRPRWCKKNFLLRKFNIFLLKYTDTNITRKQNASKHAISSEIFKKICRESDTCPSTFPPMGGVPLIISYLSLVPNQAFYIRPLVQGWNIILRHKSDMQPACRSDESN